MTFPKSWQGQSEILRVSNGTLTVHPYFVCQGRACVIHAPSEHPLAAAPLVWLGCSMGRVCVHGVVHPDRDDIAWLAESRGAGVAFVESIHDCCPDHCCARGIGLVALDSRGTAARLKGIVP